MDVHDQYVNNLFEFKSLEALSYLIDAGRELEFTYCGKVYFISCCNSKRYVSLRCEDTEQSFDSINELISKSALQEIPFSDAWRDVELEYLF